MRAAGQTDGVGGAVVRLSNGRMATANESGWFAFSDMDPADRVVATVEFDGYAEAIEPVTVRAGAVSHLDVWMVPVAATAHFDAAMGGTATDGAGASATFPAGSLVTSDGRPASGEVTLTIAPLDPSNRDQMRAFPGDFSARRTDGSSTLLETVVPMAITARQGSELLNIARGMHADITFPVPASAAANAPAMIELWSLDPSTGAWREEGTATRAADPSAPGGVVYRAQIPHLSWWNCDHPITDTTCIRGCVRAPDNRPVANVHVNAAGVDYQGESDATTGDDGCFAVDVKIGSQVAVVAQTAGLVSDPLNVSASRASMNVAGGAARCQDIGTLTLAPPLAQLILQWGENPHDLDSHMTGPGGAAPAGRFHVYYGSRGSLAQAPYCGLDTDDTTSFGPEITTLARATAGRYRFSVHNYSGQSNGPIEGSGASVVLILPRQGVVQRFEVPTSNPSNGDVWRVVDLVADGQGNFTVNPLGTFADRAQGFDP